jgi:hypothetical protein
MALTTARWRIVEPRIFHLARPRSSSGVTYEGYQISQKKRGRGAEEKQHPIRNTQEMLTKGLCQVGFRGRETLEILGMIDDGVKLIDLALCGLFKLGRQMCGMDGTYFPPRRRDQEQTGVLGGAIIHLL